MGLLKMFLRAVVDHIFRGANMCADSLAKIEVEQPIDFIIFYEPTSIVGPLLAFEKVGLFCIRLNLRSNQK